MLLVNSILEVDLPEGSPLLGSNIGGRHLAAYLWELGAEWDYPLEER